MQLLQFAPVGGRQQIAVVLPEGFQQTSLQPQELDELFGEKCRPVRRKNQASELSSSSRSLAAGMSRKLQSVTRQSSS